MTEQTATPRCAIDTGVCVLPGSSQTPSKPAATSASGPAASKSTASTRIIYITDPICSACWVIEPAWRSVLARYGDEIVVEHVMGGLLPNWTVTSDPTHGIFGPSDLPHHWAQFGELTGQTLDPSVWHRDPVQSSYPACIAVAGVRLLAPGREHAYLRRLRELLFVEATNIGRPEVLQAAATEVGVSASALARVIADGRAAVEFAADLDRTRRLGVRGFPTLIIEGPYGRQVLRGVIDTSRLESAVLAASGLPAHPFLSIPEALTALGRGSTAEYAAAFGTSLVATQASLTAAGVPSRQAGTGLMWSR